MFLRVKLTFGDWLILMMMSEHLDIKIFADILIELKRVCDANSRSVSTSIFDVNGSRYTKLKHFRIRI